MAKTAKKRLIRVEGIKGSNPGGYRNTSMQFSLVVVSGDKRRQILPAFTCREQFCYGIKERVENHSDVDFNRIRLLVIQDPNDFSLFRDKLFTGKRMINAYERAAGWTPLSKITTVKHSTYENAWLLTGPGEWMKTPQLVSTITFFLRLASVYGPFETDTVKQAEATMKRLIKESRGDKFQRKTSDLTSFLPHIWDSLKLVICEQEKIFGKVKPEEAWKDGPGGGNFGVSSGILNFVTGSPEYSKQVVAAHRRFKELKQGK